MHFIGHILNQLISGYFSDQYGRRAILIFSCLISGILGIGQAFSWNYISFTAMEFLNVFLGSALYPAVFLIGIKFFNNFY